MYLCYCLKKNDGMINVKDNNNNENNNENNNINNKNSLCKIESLSSKTSTHQIENLFNNNKSEFNIHPNNNTLFYKKDNSKNNKNNNNSKLSIITMNNIGTKKEFSFNTKLSRNNTNNLNDNKHLSDIKFSYFDDEIKSEKNNNHKKSFSIINIDNNLSNNNENNIKIKQIKFSFNSKESLNSILNKNSSKHISQKNINNININNIFDNKTKNNNDSNSSSSSSSHYENNKFSSLKNVKKRNTNKHVTILHDKKIFVRQKTLKPSTRYVYKPNELNDLIKLIPKLFHTQKSLPNDNTSTKKSILKKIDINKNESFSSSSYSNENRISPSSKKVNIKFSESVLDKEKYNIINSNNNLNININNNIIHYEVKKRVSHTKIEEKSKTSNLDLKKINPVIIQQRRASISNFDQLAQFNSKNLKLYNSGFTEFYARNKLEYALIREISKINHFLSNNSLYERTVLKYENLKLDNLEDSLDKKNNKNKNNKNNNNKNNNDA